MAAIEINYQDVMKKAERLEALAADLRRLSANDLQELLAGVGHGWNGSAAELYKKRTRTMSHQIEGRAKELESMAKNLQRAAERYRRLEVLANTIFMS